VKQVPAFGAQEQAQVDFNGGASRLWNGWIARLLGRMERQPVAQDSTYLDSSTSLLNLRGLRVRGEELMAKCQRQGRSVSLVVFDCSDLLAVREIYGSGTTRGLIDQTVERLVVLAGRGGLVARTGPAQFSVAMPLAREKVMQELVRVLGSPVRIEFDSKGSEIVVVPNFVVGSLTDGASIEKLHAALTVELFRLRQEEQRRHNYMQRKREQHSRPAPLHDDTAMAQAKGPARSAKPVRLMPVIPPTMPMPLAAR
jgi:GGDEF domain-containing protein